MEADFWHARWEKDEIGFHQADINDHLKNYWQKLGLQGSEPVFIPLCGKSMDMLWLESLGHPIIGVELSQKALDEFVSENDLCTQPLGHHQFCGYQVGNMVLLCGDFFHVSEEDCEEVAAVYDRAALVALPEGMRQDYVNHLKKVLPDSHQILLVTLEYDQNTMQGPPFSVSETEVNDLFAANYQIEKLATFELNRKGNAALEKVFHLKTKNA